jgi:glycosyltransferase involved in cell wall biosynthesis
MTPPKVSVILPTYDRPGHLRDAVESVDTQTHGSVELIVVDDHSPTPAAETLSDVSLEDATLRIIRHETNRGANEARNTGIEAATGEYVAFLDDDDEWAPSKLARQVSAFDAGDDRIGVVYTGTVYDYGSYERTVLFSLSGDVTEALLRGGSLGQFSTLMIDADVMANCGTLDTRFPSWQDRDLLLRLSTQCRFKPIEEPLTVRSRVSDEQSITDNFEEKRDISYPLFLEKHRDLAASHGVEREFVASLSENLGAAALKNGYYADARKYLLKSLYYGPVDRSRWIYALLSLGGSYTYGPASQLAHAFHRTSSAPTQR